MGPGGMRPPWRSALVQLDRVTGTSAGAKRHGHVPSCHPQNATQVGHVSLQAVHRGRERRKLTWKGRMNQLKDPFGLEEVFEPVFPKITQARSLREGAHLLVGF